MPRGSACDSLCWLGYERDAMPNFVQPLMYVGYENAHGNRICQGRLHTDISRMQQKLQRDVLARCRDLSIRKNFV